MMDDGSILVNLSCVKIFRLQLDNSVHLFPPPFSSPEQIFKFNETGKQCVIKLQYCLQPDPLLYTTCRALCVCLYTCDYSRIGNTLQQPTNHISRRVLNIKNFKCYENRCVFVCCLYFWNWLHCLIAHPFIYLCVCVCVSDSKRDRKKESLFQDMANVERFMHA